ncbi:hypothetical protein CSKR_203422 [Clonorchis sinensis]|uniref:Uncharacterized protein n=1 Tax=Clonorchis sinensis TaxID=79923 RepID=A0A8T1MBF2_CLOSI|nr:hypothetical protein CSKR_203422 [Clonorchis sinensis]
MPVTGEELAADTLREKAAFLPGSPHENQNLTSTANKDSLDHHRGGSCQRHKRTNRLKGQRVHVLRDLFSEVEYDCEISSGETDLYRPDALEAEIPLATPVIGVIDYGNAGSGQPRRVCVTNMQWFDRFHELQDYFELVALSSPLIIAVAETWLVSELDEFFLP